MVDTISSFCSMILQKLKIFINWAPSKFIKSILIWIRVWLDIFYIIFLQNDICMMAILFLPLLWWHIAASPPVYTVICHSLSGHQVKKPKSQHYWVRNTSIKHFYVLIQALSRNYTYASSLLMTMHTLTIYFYENCHHNDLHLRITIIFKWRW